MKNLNLNALFACLLFALFLSSCAQESIAPINEKAELNLNELALQVSQSNDFIAINEFRNNIFTDMVDYLEANEKAVKENPDLFDNFLNSYNKYEDDLTTHIQNLRTEIPELLNLTEDQATEVIGKATTQAIEKNTCWDICHDLYLDCDAVCYKRYLIFETFTYHDYLTCNGICVQFVFLDCLENDC